MTDIKVTIDNSLDDVKIFALEDVLENVTAIEQAGEAAIESAEDAEAWAIGERNGVPVSADDETYQNNSKYYAESASVMANKFFVTDTASGAIASFSDGADDVPMDSVLCYLNASQAGSGTPSPTNIRPISGYEAVVVSHEANMLATPYYNTSRTSNGITWTVNSDGTITADGTATADSYFSCRSNNGYLPYGTYYVSGCPSGGSSSKYYINFASWGGYGAASDYGSGTTFNHAESSASIQNKLRIIITIKSGVTVSNLVFKPMISGSPCSYDTYKPYTNTTYTTQLGQTVYGGTLDVVTGVLTVDRAYYTLSADTVFALSGSYYAWQGGQPFALSRNAVNYSCSHFVMGLNTEGGVGFAGINSSTGKYILFYKDAIDSALSISSVDEFNTYIASQATNNTPIQIAYKLATPITVQLSPHEVDSLLGTNNIWHNANGNINVIYKADTKLYIDKRLAELS